jgi:hypothetical protein
MQSFSTTSTWRVSAHWHEPGPGQLSQRVS